MFHLCLHFSRSQSINQITSALWPAHSADRAFPGQENSRAYVVTASCNGRLPIVSESISPLPTLPSDCLQFDFVRKAGLASEDNLCLIRMIFDFARFGCKFGMRPVRRYSACMQRPKIWKIYDLYILFLFTRTVRVEPSSPLTHL